jgi:broad specificity phosphatase PhoE
MAVVYLVRHGQASFGAADYDVLSEAGRRQSAALGAELARRGVVPDRVVTGSLARQRDTATLALEAAGADVKPDVDDRWNEYDHLALLAHHQAGEGPAPRFGGTGVGVGGGEMSTDGQARAVQQALDGALAAWVAAGECADCERPWPRFRDETSAAMAELVASLGRGGVGVAVTSGGVIAAVSAGLLGLPADGLVRLNRVVVNSSVTTVVSGRSGTTLLSFNEHGHLFGTEAPVTYR